MATIVETAKAQTDKEAQIRFVIDESGGATLADRLKVRVTVAISRNDGRYGGRRSGDIFVKDLTSLSAAQKTALQAALVSIFDEAKGEMGL